MGRGHVGRAYRVVLAEDLAQEQERPAWVGARGESEQILDRPTGRFDRERESAGWQVGRDDAAVAARGRSCRNNGLP